jgi:S-DNA-T family DNA segregation ATPase FtsK/SpoIIIE
LEAQPGVLAVLGADADEEALLKAIGHVERYVIVIDDAELMYETPLDDALADLLRLARDGEHGMIIAGVASELSRAFQSFLASVPKSRIGVLLAIDSLDDGDLLGTRLPRNITIGSPSGRSLFIQPGATLPIQSAVCP